MRSWFAILMGLYPALVATTACVAAVLGLFSGNLLTAGWLVLVTALYGAVLAIPVAVICALLALPLLAFQRFIVGPERPYLRPGYIAVALYGPGLLALVARDWAPSVWLLVVPYEVTVLIATLIYVRLAEPLDLFPAGA